MRLPPPPAPLDGVHAARTTIDAIETSRAIRGAACTGFLGCRICGPNDNPAAMAERTISVVKIRAVTLGFDLPQPEVETGPFKLAAAFLERARGRFGDAGIEVQTTRCAGADLGNFLETNGRERLNSWTRQSEAAARDAGIDYLSFGRVPANYAEVVADQAAEVLAAGEVGFLSADLIHGRLPSVAMAAACARAVKQLARSTDLGFGNLRFAATANCPSNIPFLPAAFHAGGPPRFAIAVQAADIVVDALGADGTPEEVEDLLVEQLEAACAPVERVAQALAGESSVGFVGIDLSPAPFPSDDASIGVAVEAAGVDRFGAPGSLYVAALITRAIRRTKVKRCGFSGLMLPLLEDSGLARRAAEHPPSLHELLLFSAVCGTGLDTVPLPEDISEDELAGIYLDVAALSVALSKPLTARLLPVPGARAGDPTTYAFEYFVNSRVLPHAAAGAAGLLRRGARV
jgi:uncharacterized protein (UPF0210 family)